MAIEDFFNHTCNIYHIQSKNVDYGYGINNTENYYSDMPDLEEIPCHFYIKTTEQLVYNKPQPQVTTRMKLALPIGTDIRPFDKVVNNVTGIEYRAEMPHNIRDHHIMVYLLRQDADILPEREV